MSADLKPIASPGDFSQAQPPGPAIDLDAYFRRIGYSGQRAATLAALRGIHERHVEAIPFENLSPLLGEPVLLDPASLERKIVYDGRGGYCFEHNLLLSHALEALGFRVKGLAARVLWNRATSPMLPRSHMVLLVEVDGEPIISDAGFGGHTLTGPLRLEPNLEQPTPHEPFRIIASNDHYIVESKIGEHWRPLYGFDLQEQFQIDYEVANYYVSTHPSSFFRNMLLASRPGRDCRHVLFNREYVLHYLDGRTETRIIASVKDMRKTLEDAFRLELPQSAKFEAMLETRLTQ